METGTKEAGCIFKEHTGEICHKLTERGTTMCPYHNLLTEHRAQEKLKREQEKRRSHGARRIQ